MAGNRRTWLLAGAGALLVASSAGAGVTDGYDNHEALTARLRALAKQHPDACQLTSIGKSREGRDLWALRLARGDGLDSRAAVAIVGGVDGDFPVTTAVATRVAESLLSAGIDNAGAKLLSQRTVYVIPCVNPDAMEVFFTTPRREQRMATRPADDDRDGAVDEDGPEDLNGDGVITMMRIRVDGGHVSDIPATHMVDAKEARLLVKADAGKGQEAIYAVLTEGIDNDGDGEYNEDGVGGVDINRNFMHEYKDHQEGVGPYPVSEPESKALIDFFIAHPRIAAALFYGRHDNVINVPKDSRGGAGSSAAAAGRGRQLFAAQRGGGGGGGGGGGRSARAARGGRGARPPSRRPRREPPRGVLSDDGPIYDEIGKKYKEITGVKKATPQPADGAVFAWAYAQYGIPSFACQVWARPEPEKKEEGPSAEGGERRRGRGQARPPGGGNAQRRRAAGMMTRRGGGGAEGGEKKGGDKEDAAWLKYSDEQRDGAGFIDWKPFDHPQLGEVEIGGFTPFFKTTPPADRLEDIAKKQTAFAVEVAGRLPELSLATPRVTRHSDELYEIETALVNDGYFPTGLAIARQNRRVRPVVVTLDLPLDRILGGTRVQQVWSVPGSGGRHELRWLVRGQRDQRVRIKVASDKYGDMAMDVTLAPTADAKEGS